ncbi:MAG: TRAP transporter small permease subunit [Proteobacteria bacterium]|nr:TRAP transporter small permease subunit [Pseudomonadota bacterium]
MKNTAIYRWLALRAENVAAAMLATMFAAFLVQIVFRYAFDLPVGWTHELSVVMWLWLVLWGAAFVVRESDEIRFDLIYSAVGPKGRRVMGIVAALGLITLYGMSLPAVVDYVQFMRVEKTAYMKIRFDWLYSIYPVFVVAILVRYVWLTVDALRGVEPSKEATHP